MSLQDIMKDLESFDPAKDKVQTFSGLPTGNYKVALESVAYQIPNTDQNFNPYNKIVFEVLDGDYAGRKENMQLGFEEKTPSGKPVPDFALDKNARTLIKLYYVLGIKFTLEASEFVDGNKIVDQLTPAVGTKLLLNLNVRPNKKNPDYPYRNYDFDKIEESEPVATPVAAKETKEESPIKDTTKDDVDNDDLPF
ncbi:hypothetical protein [Oenococcus oeni]|uniref:hypothetical protein n=1 Tax=Oenococcus oeni TaxID=1247 RepID=UPI0002979E7F|nr:hypothetical protein [Oenococcus oeni]EKP90718.1 putative phage protein [Oenococcus oeni AWRIB202]OIK77635.1 hypothetical protein ATW74_10295 [Oenococcus oeni]OIK77871.1 hypothetical protein ATW74_09780 [Oenococcus oeni]OIM39215.1 hypothetical protein ATX73_09520 [Oenococcus oeni]OLQ29325.1 hypothetical protein ATW77_09570 [Oenococcus oeni]